MGGIEAVPNEFPWMAKLLIDTSEVSDGCGGSLIDCQWVVTAAHCVFDEENAKYVSSKEVTIVLGAHDAQNPEISKIPIKEVKAKMIIPHKDYDWGKKENDIALLKLPKPVNLKLYRPICLPKPYEEFSGTALTYGWGLTSNTQFATESAKLLKLKVNFVGNTDCQKTYDGLKLKNGKKIIITEDVICAGGVKGKAFCEGDSGGPLSVPDSNGKHVLAGIVSYGPVGQDCGKYDIPGVFTKTANYRKWIDTTMATYGGVDKCSCQIF